MALELGVQPAAQRSWRGAYDTWRALSVFRTVREGLRGARTAEVPLDQWQYLAAAQRTGWDPGALERLVADWMYDRPLKYLPFCKRRGLEAFLGFLEDRGLRVGVFSDYPVTTKLERLGLAARMSVALCATDPEVNAFKPSPTGFLRACASWGLRPAEVLYVGDRPEVDAAGAANAGMPCAIISRRRVRRMEDGAAGEYTAFPSFARLQRALS